MALTNYWWLLIWIFVGGGLIAYIFPRRKELVLGKRESRWSMSAAILMVIPLIIWAGWRSNIGDTESYRKMFNQAPATLGEMSTYLSSVTKDKGFSVLTVLIKCIVGNSSIAYFIIVASIQILILALILRKYSTDYWFSIFVFVASSDYISYVYNGMRQFVAVTIVFAATIFVAKRKYIPAVLLILLASTMHQSALLMLPVIFIVQGKAWNKKTIILVIAAIVALMFIDRFTGILDTLLSDTQYENVVSDWQSWEDDGTNPLRVLVWSVPAILSLIGLKQIRTTDDPLINVCTGYSLVTVALGLISMRTSGIFMGRLPVYTGLASNLILLPWEINNIFTRDSARLVKIAAVAFYVLFFYYATFISM